jgi:transposase-like protein
MSNTEKVKESLNITDEMLNELTEGLRTQEDVFGKDYLFRQLQKAVLEKMLNKELDFHLSSGKQS